MRRATPQVVTSALTLADFYPRPPRGGRPIIVYDNATFIRFLSTPSARRATQCRSTSHGSSTYFYPRPPRGGRLAALGEQPVYNRISIHALREEGDAVLTACALLFCRFLSTPSARRATCTGKVLWSTDREFLSTPSARRATFFPPSNQCRFRHFYPRPPRGGRRVTVGECVVKCVISIHALREEGD